MSRLSDRRALVTGGAGGIGQVCALRFAREGADVVIADLPSRENLAQGIIAQVAQIGRRAFFLPVDVTNAGSCADLVAGTLAKLGGLDLVVPCAGVTHHRDASMSKLRDLQPEHWDFVQDVNLNGTFYIMRAAAEALSTAGSHGSAVLVSSIASVRATSGAYSVSKAGVTMLTRCLAKDFAPSGVRVNAIAPGFIDTEMLAGVASEKFDRTSRGSVSASDWAARVPLGRIGEPADVADVVVWLASAESSYVTGNVVFVDGGVVGAS